MEGLFGEEKALNLFNLEFFGVCKKNKNEKKTKQNKTNGKLQKLLKEVQKAKIAILTKNSPFSRMNLARKQDFL